LTLYVSNQSFEDPSVQIAISIDGVVVVDETFAVEGQHNWIAFELDVSPGDHILTATSNTGAQLTVEFTTKAGQPRWAVVDYWWYPEDGPASSHLTSTTSQSRSPDRLADRTGHNLAHTTEVYARIRYSRISGSHLSLSADRSGRTSTSGLQPLLPTWVAAGGHVG
jgi:hypothetical protein